MEIDIGSQKVIHCRATSQSFVNSMSSSSAPRVCALDVVSGSGKLGNCDIWLFSRNSEAGKVARSISYPTRVYQAFSRDSWNNCDRRRICTCKTRSHGDRWGVCRDAQNPHQHRKLHLVLASTALSITKPYAEAEETGNWRLGDDILELKGIQSQLQSCRNTKEKIAVVESSKRVQGVFGGICQSGIHVKPSVALACRVLNEQELYILKCLVAIGQEHLLDWPSVLEDVYESQDDSKLHSGTGGMVRSVKQVFIRLGNVVESWEGPQKGLLPPEVKSLQYSIPTKGAVNSGVGGGCHDNSEVHLLDSLIALIAVLTRLEKFYDSIGGIIGYQVRALELITDCNTKKCEMDLKVNGGISLSPERKFYVPLGPDLSRDQHFAKKAASWGIEGLPAMGEIYPLGGAGDRLGLVDESTGECLPVAMLPYCGRTLLEGLIRDLQAREFLYFKVFGTQQITPVAIMTSAAKQNHCRVHALCDSHSWFGRGQGNFRLFEQPLVPTVAAADGKWLMTGPLQPVLKPGGHGVIWKLAHDEGVFKWFYSKDRRAAIVRQISNPLAATDCTLLALSGIGLKHKKKFGFASCERNVGSAEGVNVLMERTLGDGNHEYAITCIEYTEFDQLGISDVPVTPGSMQAQYPANTNVLYVDLSSVEHIAASPTAASLPGMILNLKKPIEYVDQWGNKRSSKAGRLECTMQNVADSLVNRYSSRLSSSEKGVCCGLAEALDTYLIYNQRRKVTSSAKRRRKQGEHSLHQTPDGSFLDLTRNAFDLLMYCGVNMPKMEGNECYVECGPPCLVFMHPSLGPIWDIIRQKIQGGSIAEGSDLQLEIAELSWKDVKLDGSLLIQATSIMGSLEEGSDNNEPFLCYGLRCGRCMLNKVQIKNKGVDWRCSSNIYWQNKVERLETLEIILEEDAEFEASNVIIEGPHRFFVPKGHRMIVTSNVSGTATYTLKALPLEKHESWTWNYTLQESGEVLLTMNQCTDKCCV